MKNIKVYFVFASLLSILSSLSISAMQHSALMSAGILPYAKMPNGENLFLFGKEVRGRRPNTFKAWNDFGGKGDTEDIQEAKEYNVDISLYTACREFSEETAFMYGNGDKKRAIEYIVKQAKNRFISIQMGDYAAYFVEVEYRNISDFSKFKKMQTAQSATQEKLDLKWITAQQLKDKLDSLKDSRLFEDDECKVYGRYIDYLQTLDLFKHSQRKNNDQKIEAIRKFVEKNPAHKNAGYLKDILKAYDAIDISNGNVVVSRMPFAFGLRDAIQNKKFSGVLDDRQKQSLQSIRKFIEQNQDVEIFGNNVKINLGAIDDLCKKEQPMQSTKAIQLIPPADNTKKHMASSNFKFGLGCFIVGGLTALVTTYGLKALGYR